MSIPETEFLSRFGWDGFFESQCLEFLTDSLFPARVICEERGLYRLQISNDRSIWASVSGKMQFNAKGRADFPAVGDWVIAELPAQSDRAVIHHLAPRKTVIYRKQIGLGSDRQILSANVDYIFVTTSVNDDLNPRRIERYLAIAWDSGAIPVILLTKADVVGDRVSEVVADVEAEFPGVEVRALSQDNFAAADFLPAYLKPGKTAVFVGSSGVGKSTLVNYLIGDGTIKTQEISAHESKGRHTTTSRNLYVSRFGGIVIDTPGMREIQMADHAEGVSQQFSEIEDLMTQCRFGDCLHDTEPGCAIKAAMESGDLSAERWENYLKLQAEVRYATRKQDKKLAAEDKKVWKKLTEIGRERGLAKRGRRE